MNYYNSNLINSIGISKITSTLMDKNKIDEVISSLDNIENMSQGLTRGDLYITFLAINQYISKKLNEYYIITKENLNIKEAEAINYYIKKLYEKGKTNEFAFNSLCFDLDEESLKKEYSENYGKIQKTQKEKNLLLNVIERKYFDNERLSEKEKIKLFATYQIILDQGKLEDSKKETLIEFIINKEKENITLEENRLFISLIAEKEINENKIPTTFIVSDYGYDGKEKEKNNAGYNSKDKIFINKKSIDTKRGEIIQTIYHEFEHRKQYEKTINGEFCTSSLEYIKFELFEKFKKELNRKNKDFDYYHQNYFFNLNSKFRMHRIEIEADAAGYEKTAKLLKKYHRKQGENLSEFYEEKKEKVKFINHLGTRINSEESERVSTEKAEVLLLGSVIKNHPEELKNYPQLKHIFYENGKMKSLKDMLCECDDMRNSITLSGKEENPFYDYIRVGIDFGKLDDIKLDDCTKEEQNKIFNSLTSFAFINTRKIKEIVRDETYIISEEYKQAIIDELSRMKKLEKAIEKFKESKSYQQANSYHIMNKIEEIKEFIKNELPELKEKIKEEKEKQNKFKR